MPKPVVDSNLIELVVQFDIWSWGVTKGVIHWYDTQAGWASKSGLVSIHIAQNYVPFELRWQTEEHFCLYIMHSTGVSADNPFSKPSCGVRIDSTSYQLDHWWQMCWNHDLAPFMLDWFSTTSGKGEWPSKQIDATDRDSGDCRLIQGNQYRRFGTSLQWPIRSK